LTKAPLVVLVEIVQLFAVHDEPLDLLQPMANIEELGTVDDHML
jgi:hypothetical protein